MRLPYIEPSKARQYSYFVIPRVLLTNPAFKEIDCTAKVVYSLMLSRLSLSAENPGQYTDEDGRLYIVYAIDEIAETLQISRPTTVKMINQLTKAGLVEKKRQGQGKPALYYVMDFTAALSPPAPEDEPDIDDQPVLRAGEDFSEVKNLNFKDSKNFTSRNQNSLLLEVKKFESSKNDLSYLDLSENDLSNHSFLPPQHICEDERTEGKSDGTTLTEEVKEQIEYDVLEDRMGPEAAQFALDQITTVLCRSGPVTMGKNTYPEQVVKKRFRALSAEDVVFAVEKLLETPNVRNQSAYLIALLYNARGADTLHAQALFTQTYARKPDHEDVGFY